MLTIMTLIACGFAACWLHECGKNIELEAENLRYKSGLKPQGKVIEVEFRRVT